MLLRIAFDLAHPEPTQKNQRRNQNSLNCNIIKVLFLVDFLLFKEGTDHDSLHLHRKVNLLKIISIPTRKMQKATAADRLPVIFVYNILKNYYREYGMSLQLPIKNNLSDLGRKAALLPVINYNYRSSIEIRAKYIQEQLPRVISPSCSNLLGFGKLESQ
jgi:hypothetical protein